MGDCVSCGNGSGAGPFAEGKELVEFVYNAHGGGIKDQPIPDGGLETKCQGCGESFTLKTFVGKCPKCGGVHAVSPPRCHDPENIQFAGAGYKLPEE
jgi:rRNA maturation protein Nop10